MRAKHPRRITASTLHSLHQCERKLWLDVHAPTEKAPPTSFEEELRARGMAHERAVRAGLPGLVGPIFTWDDTTMDEAATETKRLLRETRAPLYQPAFVSADGTLAGVPDFLGHDEDSGIVLRDAKLFTRLEGHPEANLQMAHYCALVEGSTGLTVSRCEVVSGRFELLEVRPAPRAVWQASVARARELLDGGDEPGILQAHSTCEGCGFYDHCWEIATREKRVEIIPAVNRVTLPRLAELGITTLGQLVQKTPAQLRGRNVGAKVAENMLLEARAMMEDHPQWRGGHGLPVDHTPVWFDLEGDPDSDVEVPIYMWGVGVSRPDHEFDYRVVIADAGDDGDRGGWERFLALARDVFAAHPDAVWVHYADYERTWTRKYVERYGDADGTAARVLGAMFDLRAALQRAVVLPLRSYSIKSVAPSLGFAWRNPEANSQWSTVQYKRARASSDAAERERLFGEIAQYNDDDLRAMKHLWDWMEREAPAGMAVVPAPKPTAKRRWGGRGAGSRGGRKG